MFEKSNKYIILSKNSVFLVDSNPERQKAEKYPYSNDIASLEPIIQKIKIFADSKKIGLLMTDDLVYVFSSKMKFVDESGKPVSENALVENKIRSKIPENLEDVVWDFKSKQLDSENKLFQIAVTTPFTAELINELSEKGVKLDFVEPLSYAIARNTENQSTLHLIISTTPFENCILVADAGYVHYASTFKPEQINYDLENVFNYINNKYHYISDRKDKIKIYTSQREQETLNINISEAYKDIYEVTTIPLNIFSTDIISSKEHHGKDEEVLNVIPKKEHNNPFSSLKNIPVGKVDKNNFKLLGMIAILIILIISVVFVLLNRKDNTTNTKPVEIVDQNTVIEEEISQSDNTLDEPVATENSNESSQSQVVETQTQEEDSNIQEISQFSQYKLLILNGSGFPGDASTVNDLFTEAGFSDADLGNYPSGTTQKTIVRTKTSTSQEVLTKTAEVLNKFDLTYSEEFLEDNSPYDLVIVVGETRIE